jgi:hypothetical protein
VLPGHHCYSESKVENSCENPSSAEPRAKTMSGAISTSLVVASPEHSVTQVTSAAPQSPKSRSAAQRHMCARNSRKVPPMLLLFLTLSAAKIHSLSQGPGSEQLQCRRIVPQNMHARRDFKRWHYLSVNLRYHVPKYESVAFVSRAECSALFYFTLWSPCTRSLVPPGGSCTPYKLSQADKTIQ